MLQKTLNTIMQCISLLQQDFGFLIMHRYAADMFCCGSSHGQLKLFLLAECDRLFFMCSILRASV